MADRTAQTAVTSALLILLPVAKWLQVAVWPGWDWVRQAVLIAILLATVAWVYGRRFWDVTVRWQIVTPAPTAMPLRPHRFVHLALGFGAVAAAIASGWLVVTGAERWEIGALTGLAALLAILVVVQEFLPTRLQGRGSRFLEDHPLMWTVVPGVLWWCALIAVGLVADRFATLGGSRVIAQGQGGAALFTVVVVALGEEYLYRGLLLVLAWETAIARNGYLLLSVSFMLWHLPDAWDESGAVAVATMVVTLLGSHLIFYPLRRLGRSVGAPTFFHAANNLALRLIS